MLFSQNLTITIVHSIASSLRVSRAISVSSIALLAPLVATAFAGITVSSPYNGTDITSPFSFTADAPTCSSEPVDSIFYSLDNGSDLEIFRATA
jgi:hypothetical protein